MNLQPINPPLRDGQRVCCAQCSMMFADAWADLDATPGTFYCFRCASMADKTVKFIKACGYRVFMRNPSDKHCFYTDGTRIGYAQWSYRTSVTSVHVPSRENGTGFGIAESISEDTLADALNCVMPNWASGSVKKYKDWDAFHNADSWNKQLREVSP